ncbi:hypothetical protein [Neorhizobium sp. T6_25]|uniref:hypothetical protein n=1 Tax=Neorhizobium sp. T6_25 TaxID=2093833 RepID=UPI000CFA75C1|nr:hypothetical protein [Neorhizobium sp. T6_25]
MNASHEWNGKDSNISAARIESLLRDAASLVCRDPDATRLRLDEILVLLAVLQTPPEKQESMSCFLAPWQKKRIKNYIQNHFDCRLAVNGVLPHFVWFTCR